MTISIILHLLLSANLKVVHIAQIGLRAVAQTALEPPLPPLDGPGDGGLVDAHRLSNLPHVLPLGVIHQNHLPLLGGDILPQAADQIAL